MLRVDQVKDIRSRVLVEGESTRRVARETGLSRNTVRKYLERSEPRRVENGKRPRPVRDAAESRVQEMVADWKPRTTRKQRITARAIWRQLRVEGFPVGETVVREILRELKRREKEVFVPLLHHPGDEAQVDFFEVVAEVAGELQRAWMFLMRLMFCGRDFAWLYHHCDQVSFLDGHVRAFEHFGGVVCRCVYDNLSPAVRKVLAQRQLTERFGALCSHYLFEPCFTRVGEGHDKGGVESRGKWLRLGHLVPIPAGESLEEVSGRLLEQLDEAARSRKNRDGQTVMDLFGQEASCLRPLPPVPFEPRRSVLVSLSSKATFTLDGVVYSVPSHWARLDATAHVGPTDLVVVCAEEREVLPRKPRGQRGIQYRHYLAELRHKPQAVRQVATQLTVELGEPFGRLWKVLVDTHGGREAGRVFAKVLGAVYERGEEAVREALESALAANRTDLLALTPSRGAPSPPVLSLPPPLAGFQVEAARAADYDHLLVGGAA
jgi:transposase